MVLATPQANFYHLNLVIIFPFVGVPFSYYPDETTCNFRLGVEKSYLSICDWILQFAGKKRCVCERNLM